MAYEITDRFEELPLVTDQGARAGLVDGHAVISIGSGRDWSIDEIYLDGFRDGKHAEVEIHNLPGTSEGAIYNIIFAALSSGDHEISIQEQVNDWLDDASERRADYRRKVA